ncbi:G kinase-anchoring protein 1-B-like isoform X1 [Clavelina lepadiformis]|uniref:G kinase-anchoring protein 1-B-like isoform X1 n=1 Tax=Clavelina lepadiformis TaxID=159417 RepID=UPI004041D0F5
MSVGIQSSQNRFTSLSVQDSDSDEQKNNSLSQRIPNSKQKSKSGSVSSTNAKKRARRKKKKDSFKVIPTSSSEPCSTSYAANEWKKKDEELVEQLYHDDMSLAIELSKQEFEKQQHGIHDQCNLQVVSMSAPSPVVHKTTTKLVKTLEETFFANYLEGDTRKEKKSKEKSLKTISLEEFHQHVEKSLPIKSEPTPERKTQIKTFKPLSTSAGGGNFFESIDNEVSQIHQRQVIQSPAGAAAVESALINERVAEQVEQKDQNINQLESEVWKWKERYHHVKNQNQQLLVMLQQGEMKEKAEILLDVERLSIIKDELSSEVAELHQQLQRERSKVTKLKEELKSKATKNIKDQL